VPCGRFEVAVFDSFCLVLFFFSLEGHGCSLPPELVGGRNAVEIRTLGALSGDIFHPTTPALAMARTAHGRPILTTVPSTNHMLEPRMEAASAHERDLCVHGAPKATARITASLHGCFISNWNAYGLGRNSGSCVIGPLAA
jgi:hypothetical protein